MTIIVTEKFPVIPVTVNTTSKSKLASYQLVTFMVKWSGANGLLALAIFGSTLCPKDFTRTCGDHNIPRNLGDRIRHLGKIFVTEVEFEPNFLATGYYALSLNYKVKRTKICEIYL